MARQPASAPRNSSRTGSSDLVWCKASCPARCERQAQPASCADQAKRGLVDIPGLPMVAPRAASKKRDRMNPRTTVHYPPVGEPIEFDATQRAGHLPTAHQWRRAPHRLPRTLPRALPPDQAGSRETATPHSRRSSPATSVRRSGSRPPRWPRASCLSRSSSTPPERRAVPAQLEGPGAGPVKRSAHEHNCNITAASVRVEPPRLPAHLRRGATSPVSDRQISHHC